MGFEILRVVACGVPLSDVSLRTLFPFLSNTFQFSARVIDYSRLERRRFDAGKSFALAAGSARAGEKSPRPGTYAAGNLPAACNLAQDVRTMSGSRLGTKRRAASCRNWPRHDLFAHGLSDWRRHFGLHRSRSGPAASSALEL